MIKHAHKAMETNTTGGNDSHVPRNRSGIVLRYSTTLRRVEVVFPPRLQSTCVAHDGIEDQSARTYITTIRQAIALRNFVKHYNTYLLIGLTQIYVEISIYYDI